MVQMEGTAEFATFVSSDVQIKGEIKSEKGIRIEGQVEGSIHCKSKVLVCKGAELKAEVRASLVTIEGKVTGNVGAEEVKIENGGQVFGDLMAKRFAVAEGATFAGKVEIGSEIPKVETMEGGNGRSEKPEIPAAVASRMASLPAMAAARLAKK